MLTVKAMIRQETRSDYKHFNAIPTRWMDNDIYGHVNNVVYYSYIDTLTNEYLITEGGLDIHHDQVIGVAVESHCNYYQPLAYPEVVVAGLRVGHIGRTSVRYEIGLFSESSDTVCATAHFVHVFVDRETNNPVPIPDNLRACLMKISVHGNPD